MKERPVNMRAEEVRAILAGRKTQFRRVMKTQPSEGLSWRGVISHSTVRADEGKHLFTDCYPRARQAQRIGCPYGAPGDRLWVRECWGASAETNLETGMADILFRADQVTKKVCRWRSPVHMPRWASRITLEVVSVRVERLQDISEEDAKAEGVIETFRPAIDPMGLANNYYVEFARLWKSINGPEDWDENPWVRAVEFNVVEGGAK